MIRKQKKKEQSAREKKNDNVMRVGNTALQCGRETLEKLVSEATKGKDSDAECEECVKHKNGEQWDLIDVDARHFFKLCTKNDKACINNKPLCRKD